MWEILASENIEKVWMENLGGNRFVSGDLEKQTAEDWGIAFSFDADKLCQHAKNGYYLASTHVIKCTDSKAYPYAKIAYQLKRNPEERYSTYMGGDYDGGRIIRSPYSQGNTWPNND